MIKLKTIPFKIGFLVFLLLMLLFVPIYKSFSDYKLVYFDDIEGYSKLQPFEKDKLVETYNKIMDRYIKGTNELLYLFEVSLRKVCILHITNYGKILEGSKIFDSSDKKNIDYKLIKEFLAKNYPSKIENFILKKSRPDTKIDLNLIDGQGQGFYRFKSSSQIKKTLYILPEYHYYFPILENEYKIIEDIFNKYPKNEILLLREGASGELGLIPDVKYSLLKDDYVKQIAYGLFSSNKIGFIEYLLMIDPVKYRAFGVEDEDLYKIGYDIANGYLGGEDLEDNNKKREKSIFKNCVKYLEKEKSSIGILNIGCGHIFGEYDKFSLKLTRKIKTNILEEFKKYPNIEFVIVTPDEFSTAYRNYIFINKNIYTFENEILDLIEIKRGLRVGDFDFITNSKSNNMKLLDRVNPIFNLSNTLIFEEMKYYNSNLELWIFLSRFYYFISKYMYGNMFFLDFQIYYENDTLKVANGTDKRTPNNYIFIGYKSKLFKTRVLYNKLFGSTNPIIQDGQFSHEYKYFIVKFKPEILLWLEKIQVEALGEQNEKIVYLTNSEKVTYDQDLDNPYGKVKETNKSFEITFNLNDLYNTYFDYEYTLSNKYFGITDFSDYTTKLFYKEVITNYRINKLAFEGISGAAEFYDKTLRVPLDFAVKRYKWAVSFLMLIDERWDNFWVPDSRKYDIFFVDKSTTALLRNSQLYFINLNSDDFLLNEGIDLLKPMSLWENIPYLLNNEVIMYW